MDEMVSQTGLQSEPRESALRFVLTNPPICSADDLWPGLA